MPERWVVNASPLIVLAKIGRVSLLNALCDSVLIPAGVAAEIERGPEGDPARIWLHTDGRKWIQNVGEPSAVVMNWDLGLGETEVLSWAYENRTFTAVLDDRTARNCAAALGVSTRGTIGIILLAKRRGQIGLVSPVLEELRKAGFRLHPSIVAAAKQLAGENEPTSRYQ